MKSTRRGVFETNSSSTHSLTMCSKEDFESWKKGLVMFNEYDSKFIPTEEASKKIKEKYPELESEDEDEVAEAMADCEYKTYKQYFDESELECFTDKFKTKSNEEVIAFGKFGSNY